MSLIPTMKTKEENPQPRKPKPQGDKVVNNMKNNKRNKYNRQRKKLYTPGDDILNCELIH